VGYTDIRFTVLKRVTSDVEQEDIEPQNAWADPSSKYLQYMSAVCFLFARSIYDKKLESGERLPLGLIDSSWGGTRFCNSRFREWKIGRRQSKLWFLFLTFVEANLQGGSLVNL